MITTGDIGIIYPDYEDADFYGDMVQAWWTIEDTLKAVGEDLFPEAEHDARLTRITGHGGAYAPCRDTLELFEAHLGVWKSGGWTGDVTFRKVETDDMALARGYARDAEDTMFSGWGSAIISGGLFEHVPNTLFFWAEPNQANVTQYVDEQVDLWRVYAYNRYLADKAILYAKRVAIRKEDARRQREVAKRRKAEAKTAAQQKTTQPSAKVDNRIGVKALHESLDRCVQRHRHRVTGADAKGRPVYNTGKRRDDGVWVCPAARGDITEVLRPSVFPIGGGVVHRLGRGCARRGFRIPPEN